MEVPRFSTQTVLNTRAIFFEEHRTVLEKCLGRTVQVSKVSGSVLFSVLFTINLLNFGSFSFLSC